MSYNNELHMHRYAVAMQTCSGVAGLLTVRCMLSTEEPKRTSMARSDLDILTFCQKEIPISLRDFQQRGCIWSFNVPLNVTLTDCGMGMVASPVANARATVPESAPKATPLDIRV